MVIRRLGWLNIIQRNNLAFDKLLAKDHKLEVKRNVSGKFKLFNGNILKHIAD